MYVIYKADDEIFVCEESKEEEVLKKFFEEGKRNIDDYRRQISQECGVWIWMPMGTTPKRLYVD